MRTEKNELTEHNNTGTKSGVEFLKSHESKKQASLERWKADVIANGIRRMFFKNWKHLKTSLNDGLAAPSQQFSVSEIDDTRRS